MDTGDRPSASDLVAALGLRAHPEGGFFRETFRSPLTVPTLRGERSAATGILFLLTAGSPSRFHRLTSDELWIHQAGAPIEVALLSGAGAVAGRLEAAAAVSGAGEGAAAPAPGGNVAAPQLLVPAGVWQGARVAAAADAGAWALAACVVVPGFDFADFEPGRRDRLLEEFPSRRELILALT